MAVTRQVGSQTDAKPSAVDLTGKEFRFAKRVLANGESAFNLAGLGEQVAGVISEGKAVGLHTSVDTGNQLKVVAGATITPGQFVSSDANGAARVAAAGHVIAAQSINGAAAGELLEIDMTKVGAGVA
jgi:hypothetical protein